MNKKLGAGLALVILVISGLIWQFGIKLDSTVVSVMENAASDVMDTDVTLSDFSVDMKQGKATIGGLSAANLRGYSQEYIMVIESIEADLDVSAMQDQLLIIDSLRINNPLINYEGSKPGDSNIHKVLENIRKSSAANDARGEAKGLRIIINKLEIGIGVVAANTTQSPDKVMRIDLPPVEVFKIGQAQDGLSADEMINVVAGEIVNAVLRTVAKARLEVSNKPVDKTWLNVARKNLETDG